jgi:RNA polymerase sigma factor (sigma-70 family)
MSQAAACVGFSDGHTTLSGHSSFNRRLNRYQSLMDLGPTRGAFSACVIDSSERRLIEEPLEESSGRVFGPTGPATRLGILSATARQIGETGMTTTHGVSSQPASGANASGVAERKTSAYDDGLSTFMSVRPRLFGIVYRMLRSAAEAAEVVQDVWVRWQTADHSQVRDAEAFLVSTATRLGINVMQSARSRRETYVGPWLPEPVDTGTDPGLRAERREALEVGVLLLVEKLSATERAAYILREAFDYPYRDIADVLRVEEANARQVVARARRHLVNGQRMPTKRTDPRRLLEAFIAAAHNGDVADFARSLCVGRRHLARRSACASPARLRPLSRYSAASLTTTRRRISQLALPEVKNDHAAVLAFRKRQSTRTYAST